MEGQRYNEMSSFFLFEASADSELADSNNLEDSEANSCNLLANIASEDDAESCSCDSGYMLGFHEVHDRGDQDSSHLDEDEDDDEVDERVNCKRVGIDQMRGLSKRPFGSREEIEEEYSSFGGVDGSRKIMDDDEEEEIERNKLFWETCMEVGYP